MITKQVMRNLSSGHVQFVQYLRSTNIQFWIYVHQKASLREESLLRVMAWKVAIRKPRRYDGAICGTSRNASLTSSGRKASSERDSGEQT